MLAMVMLPLGVLLSLVMLAVLFFHIGSLFREDALNAQSLIVTVLCAITEIAFVIGFMFYGIHYRQIRRSDQ